MSSVNLSIDLLRRAALNKQLTVFCGAGISMLPPSKAPSWWEIYYIVASELIHRFKEAFSDYTGDLSPKSMLEIMDTQQLADLIISEFAGPTFVEILKAVDVADPNENHRLLIALAAKGYAHGIVTTNWDTLLERSAAIGGVILNVITPELTVNNEGAESTIIKLHGTAVDAMNLKESFAHKAKLTMPTFRQAWQPICQDNDLLVIGFSGADIKVGIVGAFFDEFLQSGRTIYWLYRPGTKPELPELVMKKVHLIEGQLPDFLQTFSTTLPISQFITPVTNRNAQQALKQKVIDWSKSSAIGKWGAAKFLLALLDRKYDFNMPENTELYTYLMELAQQETQKLQPHSRLSLDDLALAIFLGEAVKKALKRAEYIDQAVGFAEACVRIFESFNDQLKFNSDSISRSERLMNLSSSWNMYGHTLVINGKLEAVRGAFNKSSYYAYSSNIKAGFLFALVNLMNYHLEYSCVRTCIQLLEPAIRIADRNGYIDAGIELRLALASYHLSRNELWTSERLLQQAENSIQIVHKEDSRHWAGLLKATLKIKQGEIAKGLYQMADVLSNNRIAFINSHVDRLRRLLDIIGIPNQEKFFINLDKNKIPSYIQQIEEQIENARQQDKLPWDGQHCQLVTSSVLDKADAQNLYGLGLLEFSQQPRQAVALSLSAAGQLINQGYIQDAHWYIQNVLSRSDLTLEEQAYALFYSVYTHSELGYITQALNLLIDAKACWHLLGKLIPDDFVVWSFWLCIQADKLDAALTWVNLFTKNYIRSQFTDQQLELLLVKISSHGSKVKGVLKEVIKTLHQANRLLNFSIEQLFWEMPKESKYLFFRGIISEQDFVENEDINKQLDVIQIFLKDGQAQTAFASVKNLFEQFGSTMSKRQAELTILIQVQIANLFGDDQVNQIAENYRQHYLNELDLNSLCMLEYAILLTALKKQNSYQEIKHLIKNYEFIIEFSISPLLRANYAILADQVSASIDYPELEEGLLCAAFFNIPLYNMLSVATAQASQIGPLPISENGNQTEYILKSFLEALPQIDTTTKLLNALKGVCNELDNLGSHTFATKAIVIGQGASWLLNAGQFKKASELFEQAERMFRSMNDIPRALNAIAGQARSLSRKGQYKIAIELFQRAIEEGKSHQLDKDFLGGLAAAHLLKGISKRQRNSEKYILLAIDLYQQAIKGSYQQKKAYFKLGMARAYGELGNQMQALIVFDEACSDLAHYGNPEAKVLLENRQLFEEGHWEILRLR